MPRRNHRDRREFSLSPDLLPGTTIAGQQVNEFIVSPTVRELERRQRAAELTRRAGDTIEASTNDDEDEQQPWYQPMPANVVSLYDRPRRARP